MAKSTQIEMLIGGRVAGSLMKSYQKAEAGAKAVGDSAAASFEKSEVSAVKAGGAIRRAFAFAERRQAKLTARMEKAQAGAALTGQVIKYRGALEKLQANQVRFGRTTERVNQATRQAGRLYRQAKREARDYGIDVKRVGQAHRRYVKDLKKTEKAMRRLAIGQALLQKGGEKLRKAMRRLTSKTGALIGGVASVGTVKLVADLQTRFTRLGIQARISDEEVKGLKKTIFETASAEGIRIDPGELTSAVEKIVEKTGDLDLARDNMKNIALAIQATGAAGSDVGAMVADLQAKFGLKGKEEFLQALDTLTAQGKAGAFTLQNLAIEGEGVTASYAAMGRTGPKALREMGALLQVFRGGTKSSAEAATTFTAVMRELVAKSSQIEDLGVEIWDPEQLAQGKKVARAVPDVLNELIEATDGDISQLSKIFGEEAAKGIKVLITEFQKAGKLPFDKYLNISGNGSELMTDAARASKTFGAALQNLYTVWQKFADESLTGPIEGLASLLNSMKPEKVQATMEALKYGAVALGGIWAGKKVFNTIGGISRLVKGAKAGGLGGALDSAGGSMARGGVQRVAVVNWPAGMSGAGLDIGGGAGRKGKRGGKGISKIRSGKKVGRIGGLIRRVKSVPRGIAKKGGLAIGGLVGGAAIKAGSKGLGKAAAKIGGKALGKSLLKKVPGLGILAGLAFGAQRLFSGDALGALGEVASGVAGTIPGLGTAASVAIDAGLAARDIHRETSAAQEEKAPAEAKPEASTKATPGEALPSIQITINAPNDIRVGGVEQFVQALESGQGRLVEALRLAVNDAVTKSRRASFAAS